jgi:hypothetical protein
MKTLLVLLACLSCVPRPIAPENGSACERFCSAATDCSGEWSIDPEDGQCLASCEKLTEQGLLCPSRALSATTCQDLSERSRCE